MGYDKKILGILAVVGVLVGLFLEVGCTSRPTELEVKAPVWETYTFRSGEGALAISDQPCTQPLAMEKWERIRAGVRARYNEDIGEIRQSRLLWLGKVYAGCYVIGPDNGRVYNIDSLGEGLRPAIPRALFVPLEGALPGETGV